jgi:hypothetical protein
MVDIFRIVDQEGEWHIQGCVPEDARQAKKLIDIMYGVATRKTGNENAELSLEIMDSETLM